LERNTTKAHKLYTKVIQSGTENSFYVSHAYFNLGQIIQFGDGLAKNLTKALRYYNQSSVYEPNAFYPALITKYSILIETSNISELTLNLFTSIFVAITKPGWLFYSLLSFFIFYVIFFLSLYYQKD